MNMRAFPSILAVAGWTTAGWLAVQVLRTETDIPSERLDTGVAAQVQSPGGTPSHAKTAPEVTVRDDLQPGNEPGASSSSQTAERLPAAAPPVDSLQNISDQLRADLLAALGGADASRYEALLELGLNPSNDDFRSILAEAAAGDDRSGLHSSPGIVRLWAEHDPAAAAEWARNQQDSVVLRYSVGTIARRWAQTDAQAAYAWAETLPPGSARDMAINQSVRHLSETDPRSAAQALALIDKENYRAAAAGNLARNWLKSSPDAAETWIRSLSTGQTKDRALAALARHMTKEDPLGAVEVTLGIDDENTADQSIAAVVREWANRDLDAAADFARSLPPGQSRDMAVRHLAPAFARSDPQAALEWSRAISDPAQRQSARVTIARIWLSQEPDAAMQWVEQAILSERQKNHLQKYAERMQERKQSSNQESYYR